MPAWAGGTTDTAVEASAGLTRPIPTPPTRKPASRSVQPEVAVSPAISTSETAISAMPLERISLTGTRTVSRPEIGDDEEDEHGHRQEAQPGLERPVAEHVLDVEREVEVEREDRGRQREADERGAGERRPAQQARRRTSAAGRAARRSRTQTSSAAEPVRQPTISALPQPAALPWVSA